MKSAWCAVLAIAFAGTAWGRTPDGDEKSASTKSVEESPSQVEKLSAELRAQRAELDAQKAQIEALTAQKPAMSLEGSGEPPVQDKKPGEFELKASFEGDGLFHMKSSDGNFDLHIGGRLEEEYRYIIDRPIGPAGLTVGAAARAPADSFYLREAFISVDGTVWKDWGFKVNGDFTSGAAAGAALEEGFVEWKHFKEFRLQMGQFKVAQSYEYMGSPRFLEEIQRSAMARWNPGIEMGLMATGSVADGRLLYWLGVSNGRGHLNNNGRAVVDDNDAKAYQVKLAVLPFAPDKDSPLRKLRVGGYYSRDIQGMGQPGSAAPGGAVTLGNVATNQFGTTWITMPGNCIGERQMYGLEAMYAVGSFSVRAEYQMRKDHYENAAGTINDDVPVTGAYLTLTWLLTGEDKTYVTRPNPGHNLDFEGGWGAIELVTRFSVCSVDWDKFKAVGGSVAAGANSNKVSEFTAGFNWWTTKNTRISADYVAEMYNDPLQFESNGAKTRSSLGGILMRFQIDF